MTEPATPKPFITRRRVIAGAIGVLAIVAVMGLGLGVFDLNPAKGLKLDFVRFDKAQGDQSTVAVVRLINTSGTDFVFLQQTNNHEIWVVFSGKDQKLQQSWTVPYTPGGFTITNLSPHSEVTREAQLPTDGRVGRLRITYHSREDFLTAHRGIRSVFRRLLPLNENRYTLTCEQWIQSPKKLPDGTVEPPRLISAPGAKP